MYKRPDPVMDARNEKHYAAIGKIVVVWSRFEYEIHTMVRLLAGVNNAFGRCITAQIPSAARAFDALIALAELRSPGISKDKSFKRRMERIQSLAEQRNRAVHDVWTFDPNSTSRWSTTVRKRYAPNPKEVHTAELERLASDIEDCSDEFLQFRRDLLTSLELWPNA
jgi:spore cortex formation protein SpoVR/YcgB (stage V sporulation)